MPEKPDGKSISDKALSNKGQEPINALKHDGAEPPGETPEKGAEPASKKLAETAWAPGSETQIANVQVLPPGFPQPELVSGSLILEGQVMPAGSLHPSWELTDQQVNERAKQVREALDRRSFLGLGGPDPDLQQVTKLLEGLKLSDRRAIEMVLSKEHDFRQDLQTKLADKPNDYNNLIKMLDRPDRSDSQAMDNPQTIFYARKIIESLKDFSKDGVDTTVNLLMPLSQAEKQQIERELSSELQVPFRDWLKRTMPVGHHTVGLNNEGIARIEAVLDQPDSATDYKGSFKVLMAGLKDNWSADKENAVLHIVSGMDGKEVRESGLFKELSNLPHLSKSAHDALDVLLTGRDKWTQNPTQAQSLAETALAAKNLEMFKDAMQSELARKFFRSEKGSQEIDSAFSGPFDARQKQIAHDYADLNDTKLLTDLQMYQFSLSPSKEAITQRLISASDDEKKLFQQGRDLADLRPKETPEERAASKYYLEVYEALRSASKYDSQQLKEWTGILLAQEAKQKPAEDPKQQALKQIIDDNRLGLTGLDAVRHLETALRLNPEFAKTLQSNSLQDKELKQAFESALKRIADSSTTSSVGSTAWKELTDINNYNPLTALAATPDRMQRQQELSQRLAVGSSEQLQKQLLSRGQLSLEQKLHIAGDTKLTADDLLTLEPAEKERLLKGQYPHQVQEKVFGEKDQSEFVKSVLSKQDAKLTELDQVRAFTLGLGNGNQSIESLLGEMKADQRKQLSDQYFDKYKSVMNSDILSQVKDPVDKAKMQQYLRHASTTFEQKLVDVQVEQTKHASAFDGLSEAYSPDQRMANKYARAAESFYRQVKDGLTDEQKASLDKLPPEKKEEIAGALMKYQSALKRYWSAQRDYTHNKEEMSEQLADATLTAGAVIASIAQPELSPALLARTAVLSAAGRLGIKQAVMDKDFDTSNASVQKELYKGSMVGVLNSLGGEAFTSGRFMALNKLGRVTTNAAEKTISDLGANQTLKSVLKADAEQLLNSKLETTTMDKVFGSQKKCQADAKDLARSISTNATDKQIDVIAQTIQQHRRQEVLNTFKGKFWQEGDQLATSMTASIAGASFAEVASTAAGYEKPETLIQRLELAGKSAAVGGAIFHIGFKAAGSGVRHLSALIGKDDKNRLFAGPGTHVRTAEGKEITVGKEPYYFQPNDNVVEFKRGPARNTDDPAALIAASMPHPTDFIPEPRKAGSSASTDTAMEELTKRKSQPIDAFTRLTDAHKHNLMNLSDEKLDFFLDVYTNKALPALQKGLNPRAEDLEQARQTIAFLNLIKATRARASGESTLGLDFEKQLPGIPDSPTPQIADEPDDLAIPRFKKQRAENEVRQLAQIYGVGEDHIRDCFALPTNELLAAGKRYHELYARLGTDKFFNLTTFTDLAINERIDHHRFKHSSVDPERIASLASMNAQELALQRTFTETTANSSKDLAVQVKYKNELAAIRDLEAEHLSRFLDLNSPKRLLQTETPSIGEEIRLLYQFNLANMRESINALIHKPTPESMNPSRIEKTEYDLARMKGLPKITGIPVQITESLAAVPWKHGEILYSNNRTITINDHVAKTSHTINASGQLIETYNSAGQLRELTYESPTTNEVKKMVYQRGGDTIIYEKQQGTYHKTTIKNDGSQDIENLSHITKIEGKIDGSYVLHEVQGRQVVFPDGSGEVHVKGRRTQYEANIDTEKALLKANIKAAFKDAEGPEVVRLFKNQPDLDKLYFMILAAQREARFNKLLSEFESLSVTNNIPVTEQAVFYKHLNRILDDNKNQSIKSQEGRRELAEQVLYNATHTREIDQGQNSTCNVTTVEKRCWAKYPAAMAQFAADVAEHGQFITTSGEIIDMKQFKHGIRPDIEARQSLKLQRSGRPDEIVVDGKRGWLSQMTQIAMVNSAWKKESVVITPGGVINSSSIAFDSKSNLLGQIDPSAVTKVFGKNKDPLRYWDGAAEVYNDKGELLNISLSDLVYDSERHIIGAFDHSKVTPLYDSNQQVVTRSLAPGEIIYNNSGQEAVRATQYGDIEYGKVGSPIISVKTKEKLKDLEALMVRRGDDRDYCRNKEGVLIRDPDIRLSKYPIISHEITGQTERSFVVAKNNVRSSQRDRTDITTKEELAAVLNGWRSQGDLPGIIYVHAGKPPFNDSYDPSDASALQHGWHVINAWGFDGTMVDITNQWGKKHNEKITLEQLFEAMSDPAGKTGFK